MAERIENNPDFFAKKRKKDLTNRKSLFGLANALPAKYDAMGVDRQIKNGEVVSMSPMPILEPKSSGVTKPSYEFSTAFSSAFRILQ